MSLDVGTEARCLEMESHHSSPGLPVSIITKRKKESLLLVFYYSSLAHTLTETINFKRTVTWVPRNDFHSHQCPDYVLCPILPDHSWLLSEMVSSSQDKYDFNLV